MKAYTISLIMFCFGANSWSETTLANSYRIISDVYVDSIPEGKCLVQGQVYEADSKFPVEYAFVGTVARDFYTHSKSDGKFQLIMDAKQTGIYFHHFSCGEVVLENYNFKSQHCVTIVFKTKHAEVQPITVEKPVIYLYSKRNTEVELKLIPKGPLTFSYPNYQDGWNVKVNGKGTLEVNHKNYPYLFWEGEHTHLDFKLKNGSVEGFYIKTDSTVQFLERVLSKAGLNSSEMTDFITYWAPRVMKYEYATIQFLLGDDYANSIAELISNPKPDSELRIFMLFQGFNENVPPNYLVEPSFDNFKRKGFTLVEWGGAQL